MRIFGIVLTALFGVPFLWCAWTALGSRFGVSEDVHGYAMIFGTLAAMTLAIPTALVVPLILPRGTCARAMLWSLVALLLVDAALFIALVTA